MVIQRCWIFSLAWSRSVSKIKTGRPELSIERGKYVLSNQTIEFDGICSKVFGLLTLLSNRDASIDCRISWFSGFRPENLRGAYAPFLGTRATRGRFVPRSLARRTGVRIEKVAEEMHRVDKCQDSTDLHHSKNVGTSLSTIQ